MKKFIFILSVILMTGIANLAIAEKYYVYDGTIFNVMLTCDDYNNLVQKVSFTSENKWHEFTIVCHASLGEKNGNGWFYTVQDGKGVPFTILYFRDKDYIRVTNAMSGEVWTLNRRNI